MPPGTGTIVFNHVQRLLRLAFPLILSSSAVMTMQIIDTIVLSWHSAEAVAAMGPSSLAVGEAWMLATVFIGATAVTWMVRFQSGAWQKARVLRETVVPTV
ncbi:MAG: hypothetical protein SWC96_13285 [Thermodesulfobacteriota bacterium]|nr:hypothetical protein [Thermodesulfobacteriota bacterium]